MGNNDYALFGQQLKKCRAQAKATQAELAAVIGKDASLISHYERGKNVPKRKRLEDLVLFLKRRGAQENCLAKLYEYSGYARLEDAHPIINRMLRMFDSLSQEPDTELLERVLVAVIDDWEKHCNALRDWRRGEWEDAQKDFEELLRGISGELPFRRLLRIRANRRLANAYLHTGEPLKGLDYLDEAVWHAEDMGEDEQKMLAQLLLDRGDFYRRLNDWDKAQEDYNRSRRMFKRFQRHTAESQDIAIATIERKLAGTLLFQGKPSKALEHCTRSVSLCDALSYQEGKWKGQQHTAWAYALLGHWVDALKIHRNVVSALESQGASPRIKAKGKRFLADTYQMCSLFSQADKIYTEALSALRKLYRNGGAERDLLVRGMILLGQGRGYRHAGKRDAAQQHLNESLKVSLRLRAKLHEALSHRELGNLASESQAYGQATRALHKAKDIFENLGNEYSLIGLLIDLAELEYHRADYAKARAYVTNAINKAAHNNFLVHHIRAQQRLAEINFAEPDEQEPFSLYLSSLKEARNLNPYLVYEVLSRMAGQQRALSNEDAVWVATLQVCKAITNEWNDPLKNGTFSGPGREEWLREITRIQTDLEGAIRAFPFSKAHGLIVGVGAYRFMKSLAKTTIDAQDLYELLAQGGYLTANLELLLDEQATKRAISNALDHVAHRADPEDTVLIFFSGHGAQQIGGFEIGEYICPVEADPDNLPTTAISNKDLTTAIKAIPAKQVIVFLDACHSGGVGEPKSGSLAVKAGLSSEAYEQLAVGEGRVVIASCTPDEYSWEIGGMRNGLFSHYMLEGLRGAAARDDGMVPVFDLFEYLSVRVPTHASQHPLIKATTTNNFPVFQVVHQIA